MCPSNHTTGRRLRLKLDPRSMVVISHQHAIDAVLIDRWLNNLVAGVRSDRADVGEGEPLLAVILIHDTPCSRELMPFACNSLLSLIIARGATAYRQATLVVNKGGMTLEVDGRCGGSAGVWYTRARSTAGPNGRARAGG